MNLESMTQQNKFCRYCNLEKPICDFYFNSVSGGYSVYCKGCQSKYNHETKDKTKSRAYKRAWYAAHKEQVQAYRDANKERLKAFHKTNYEANKEKIKLKSRAWYQANKEKAKKRQKAYRDANKEKLNENQRAYRDANKEKIKVRLKNYKIKDQSRRFYRSRQRRWSKKWRDELRDGYVAFRAGISMRLASSEVIALKRQALIAHRLTLKAQRRIKENVERT